LMSLTNNHSFLFGSRKSWPPFQMPWFMDIYQNHSVSCETEWFAFLTTWRRIKKPSVSISHINDCARSAQSKIKLGTLLSLLTKYGSRLLQLMNSPGFYEIKSHLNNWSTRFETRKWWRQWSEIDWNFPWLRPFERTRFLMPSTTVTIFLRHESHFSSRLAADNLSFMQIMKGERMLTKFELFGPKMDCHLRHTRPTCPPCSISDH
jgi:hypothetical protein